MTSTGKIGGLQAGRTVVVAIGGNALQPPGERGDIHQQFAYTRSSLAPIVAMAGAGWHITIVHGNGPQIGDELHRNELSRRALPPLPLGVLVAATAGWIGYMLQQSLQNALANAGIDRDVVTIISQVIVDPDDPATHEPVKPIGRVLDKRTARAMQRDFKWHVREDEDGYRRIVPSPVPLDIVERDEIRDLIERGRIVIAAGGGGTPVYRHPVRRLEGVDGVVDKDRAAAVLARAIDADVLLILTNVDGVYRGYGTENETLLRSLRLADAEELLRSGELGQGSMAPKVEAAMSFVRTGGKAMIARLDQGMAALNGEAGTVIQE